MQQLNVKMAQNRVKTMAHHVNYITNLIEIYKTYCSGKIFGFIKFFSREMLVIHKRCENEIAEDDK